jgi:hypothetical protein
MRTERFLAASDSVSEIAIFIVPTEDGTHAGLLHRIDGTLYTLDLMWHEQLRSAPYLSPRCSCVIPDLEVEEANDVAAICRLIHRRHVESGGFRMPYAFRLGKKTVFDEKTGTLILADGLGLTCSTFVLTVFESARIPLVDLTNWPRRDGDDARHAALLRMMRDGVPEYGIPPASSEHVAKVTEELPCIRVRPEETVAAGLFNLPACFRYAAIGGEWILSQLRRSA